MKGKNGLWVRPSSATACPECFAADPQSFILRHLHYLALSHHTERLFNKPFLFGLSVLIDPGISLF
jgi:hypothetical protein